MLNKKNLDQEKPSLKIRLFAFALNSIMVVAAAAAVYILIVFLQMPSLDSILRETRLPSITFLDKDGNEIRSSNKIMGRPVSVNSLPPHVWQAIIAIEDKRFFSHGAIDIRGMTRAVFYNLASGRIAAGGSSISQQTAKNVFLSRDKKMSRKIQELILSYWLENRFDKNQILDLYMNRVSLAGGLRGIDAASKILFQKNADKLTIAQSAQIAAMLKAPTAYSPAKNPERNIARARVVLKEMVRQGYITLDQARAANKDLRPAVLSADTNIYRYWTDFVIDEVESRLGSFDSDLQVHTTMDSALQERIAAAVSEKLGGYQGAALAISRKGAIRGMVGGADYQSSQFNRALAMRQPGSAFKTVVYLAALENGMTSNSYVNDSPFAIGDYNPKNYNQKYYGDMTLAAAFAKSVNSVPLKLAEKYGMDEVLSMAGRLGVGAKLRREYSTVLGASEMSLMDLTTMYGVIWNEGRSVRPYSIEKITSGGAVLYERNPSEPIQILTAHTAEEMQRLLADVIKPAGTGHRAAAPDVLGGKTGTSNENRDAWFIGATRNLTIGVWVGNDDFSPMSSKITGGTIPAEIFKKAAAGK
ncbi:MAG: transglycosylase domain-containing protein [Rickettsiales bacterium]|jgi:penicillin-binding protein 1A|nr:transglycosylase domain-containing protein [Rickettsiales bacterium]